MKGAGIITECANNDTAEAKGLAQNTKYDLYVRTFCNEVDASPWTFAGTYFTVPEYIKELPYVYSFDDPSENAKWGSTSVRYHHPCKKCHRKPSLPSRNPSLKK